MLQSGCNNLFLIYFNDNTNKEKFPIDPTFSIMISDTFICDPQSDIWFVANGTLGWTVISLCMILSPLTAAVLHDFLFLWIHPCNCPPQQTPVSHPMSPSAQEWPAQKAIIKILALCFCLSPKGKNTYFLLFLNIQHYFKYVSRFKATQICN